MLLNSPPAYLTPASGTALEPLAAPFVAAAAPLPAAAVAPALPAEPLRGRALLARLEALAQAELAQLAAGKGLVPARVEAAGMDAALASLAWDLGLSGDALAQRQGL